jgi:hypothetical protein
MQTYAQVYYHAKCKTKANNEEDEGIVNIYVLAHGVSQRSYLKRVCHKALLFFGF